MGDERKAAYEAIYAAAANGHEIRIWWDARNGWQATVGKDIPEPARNLVKLLIAELSR